MAGVKGELEDYLGQIYDTLMSENPMMRLARLWAAREAVRHPEDKSEVSFRLREQARWHDGKPVTVEDVIFSFEALKKHSPRYASYFRNVVKAGNRRAGVTFRFDQANNRELPQIMGQFPFCRSISGRGRDISQTTLAIPLGSGP